MRFTLLRNSYVLGFLLLLLELFLNGMFLFVLGVSIFSGIIIAPVIGFLYSYYHKQKMPFIEKIKALAVYGILLSIISLFVVLVSFSDPGPFLALAIVYSVILLYTFFMYFMIGLGSWQYMRAYERTQLPPDQQAALTQDPLSPIPNSKEFSGKYPRISFGLGIVGVFCLFVGATFIAFDALAENSLRLVAAGSGLFLAWVFVFGTWKAFRKKLWVALLSSSFLVLAVGGVYSMISQRPPPASGADAIMIALQESVNVDCIERGADLDTQRRRFERNIPRTGSPVCKESTTNWPKLPTGWVYTRVLDGDMSDRTFTFGARSSAGDYIFCSEKWCVLRNAEGETTVLSTTPEPLSSTTSLSESKNVRAGEEVEIAQITVTNSTDQSVDLLALWYKKSGTASNSAIEMVSIVEGAKIHGINFMHYLGRSTNDMVYFNQPGMFTLEPKQSRTYSIRIKLNDNMPLEVGKTIGLDFVGFSYEPQVSGMPASGATHTIVQ